MPELLLPIAAVLAGFVGLVWSADRFVEGSAAIAKNLGLPPLIIGLTIVSFGTSAPEVLVSVNAALSGVGELAIGNALGSNLANMGLVLGVTALVAVLPIQKHLLLHEWPVLLFITAISGFMLADAQLHPWEGWVLLLLLVPSVAFLIVTKKKTFGKAELDAEEEIPELPVKSALFWFFVGLILLVLSSRILVWGASATANYFHVSPLVIGLTVVAVGTSLPELAASVVSALKGHHDIALGNVIGSNMFNLLAVMSVPALFGHLQLEAAVFSRDYLVMAGLTLLLFLLTFGCYLRSRGKTQTGLGKFSGVILLGIYAGYYYLIFS